MNDHIVEGGDNGSYAHKKGYYHLDTKRLKELKGVMSHKQFATKIKSKIGTAKKLVDTTDLPYVAVHEETATGVSEGFGISIFDIIYRRPFPDAIAFYESITHGWFIDNCQGSDREHPKRPMWYSERIALTYVKEDSEKTGRLTFTGEINNCYKNRFDVTAELLTQHMFCMRSTHDDKRLAFVGTANLYIPYPEACANIIMGTWTGFDIAGFTSVFRWILTDRPISDDELKILAKAVHIEAYFETNACHKSFGHHDDGINACVSPEPQD